MTFAVEDLQRIQMREDPIRIFYEKYESVKFTQFFGSTVGFARLLSEFSYCRFVKERRTKL